MECELTEVIEINEFFSVKLCDKHALAAVLH